MTTQNQISEIAHYVRTMIPVAAECGSFYKSFFTEDGEIKIRVSNHSANRQNNDIKTISFVTNITPQRRDGNNAMAYAEYLIDTDGEFFEEFTSLEECLTFNL